MQKKYILIAEDEDAYAKVLSNKLTSEGFDVARVKNGQELMEKIKNKLPDLIIMDLMMPIKDGFETLAQIRADNKFKKVKIIVMSNLGQPEDMQKVKAHKVNGYFIKTNIQLKDAIKKIKETIQS